MGIQPKYKAISKKDNRWVYGNLTQKILIPNEIVKMIQYKKTDATGASYIEEQEIYPDTICIETLIPSVDKVNAYENDIVLISKTQHLGYIKYDCGAFEYKDLTTDLWKPLNSIEHAFKIIGNICENISIGNLLDYCFIGFSENEEIRGETLKKILTLHNKYKEEEFA